VRGGGAEPGSGGRGAADAGGAQVGRAVQRRVVYKISKKAFDVGLHTYIGHDG
jgi:hypothetical protein